MPSSPAVSSAWVASSAPVRPHSSSSGTTRSRRSPALAPTMGGGGAGPESGAHGQVVPGASLTVLVRVAGPASTNALGHRHDIDAAVRKHGLLEGRSWPAPMRCTQRRST